MSLEWASVPARDRSSCSAGTRNGKRVQRERVALFTFQTKFTLSVHLFSIFLGITFSFAFSALIMRSLTLHASALNDAEYDLYTSSLRDLVDSDDAPNDSISFNDASYEQLRISVREARAWLRGRYNDLPVQQIDSILKAIAPANVQAEGLSAGQFFAVMRLVMHARTGKEPDPSLVFVQGKQSSQSLFTPP